MNHHQKIQLILKDNMKIEITDEMVDGARQLLLAFELNIYDFERLRYHLVSCGVEIHCWPEWAKVRKGHITKSSQAILIYTMMENERTI